LKLIWGYKAETIAFVCAKTGLDADFGHCQTAFVVDENELVAGIVLHDWQPAYGVIEVSAAANTARWLTRPVVREIADYVFNQLECQALVIRTSERNSRARKMWRSLGAHEYVIPRLRGRDEAEVIATLTVEAWREFEGKMQ
jgi:RimJ/RimL family protein N-acetyltransferase